LELDPVYIDVAIRRYQAYTGKLATLAETGQTYAEVAAARGIPLPEGGKGKASTSAVPVATADIPTEPDESSARAAAARAVSPPEGPAAIPTAMADALADTCQSSVAATRGGPQPDSGKASPGTLAARITAPPLEEVAP
jgi:hypothetical protein